MKIHTAILGTQSSVSVGGYAWLALCDPTGIHRRS